MKIAMLNCLRANDVCAGAACLRAFNAKIRHFAPYGDTPLELTAFARCSGCEAGLDAGFAEKLDAIVHAGTEVCHLGVCTVRDDTKAECPVITQAADHLAARGVRIVRGTH